MKKLHFIFLPLILFETLFAFFSFSRGCGSLNHPASLIYPFGRKISGSGAAAVCITPDSAFYVTIDLLMLTLVLYFVLIYIINKKNSTK